MAATAVAHRYDPAACARQERHEHDYRPRDPAVTRCRCGHSRFTVVTGGDGEPVVICAKCSNLNRTATCYEQGRTDAAGDR